MRAMLQALSATSLDLRQPRSAAARRSQHQFQNNICGSLRPNGSCFHQCESHRLPLSQPLPPIVEGLFRNLLLPTKLLHGHPAALLRSNPFAPTFFSVSDFLFHAGSLRHGPLCVIQTALKTAVHKALTLLEHLNETGTVLKAQHPTGFKFELCSPEERI